MRTAAKRDKNEPKLVEYLRRCGASVAFLGERGVPDLLVGYRGHTLALEVKGKTGDLTDPQKDFFSNWNGQAWVVRTISDVKHVLRRYNMAYAGEVWVRDLPQKPGEVFDAGWTYPLGLGVCPIHLVVVRSLPDVWCVYAMPRYLPPDYVKHDPYNANTVRAWGWKLIESDARKLFPQMKDVPYHA